MKHILLQNDLSYNKRGKTLLPAQYDYDRRIGAWITKRTTILLVKDSIFPWAATKKKDISLGEDMK